MDTIGPTQPSGFQPFSKPCSLAPGTPGQNISEAIAIPPSCFSAASQQSTAWPLGHPVAGLRINVCSPASISGGSPASSMDSGCFQSSGPSTPTPCALAPSQSQSQVGPARLRCYFAAASDNDLGRRAYAHPPPILNSMFTSLSVSLDSPISMAVSKSTADIVADATCTIAHCLQGQQTQSSAQQGACGQYPHDSSYHPGSLHHAASTPCPAQAAASSFASQQHQAGAAGFLSFARDSAGLSPEIYTNPPAAARPFSGSTSSAATAATYGGTPPSAPYPQAPQHPQQAAAPVVAPNMSVLLTVSPALPRQMSRPVWSLADYDIAKRIFKGAMSAVYQATCKRSGLPVALKVYFLNRVPANATHMVAREITIHSDLIHKNIISLYGAFQEEGRLVLVQEFASRGDLHHVHRSMGRRMSEDQVRQVVLAPFLEALAHMHSRGICHRDVKPENLMFTADWRLKVGDFGVSINMAEERAVTRAGTLDYMAPEVERCPIKFMPQDNKNNPFLAYTTAVDVWAVGVLAYELMVGFPPFIVDPNNPANGSGKAHTPRTPPAAASDGVAAGGCASGFLAANATRDALSFPASLSAAARDFISSCLAERPEERPTVVGLMQHPWVRRVMQTQSSAIRSAPGAITTAASAVVSAGTPAATAFWGPQAAPWAALQAQAQAGLLGGSDPSTPRSMQSITGEQPATPASC